MAYGLWPSVLCRHFDGRHFDCRHFMRVPYYAETTKPKALPYAMVCSIKYWIMGTEQATQFRLYKIEKFFLMSYDQIIQSRPVVNPNTPFHA